MSYGVLVHIAFVTCCVLDLRCDPLSADCLGDYSRLKNSCC